MVLTKYQQQRDLSRPCPPPSRAPAPRRPPASPRARPGAGCERCATCHTCRQAGRRRSSSQCERKHLLQTVCCERKDSRAVCCERKDSRAWGPYCATSSSKSSSRAPARAHPMKVPSSSVTAGRCRATSCSRIAPFSGPHLRVGTGMFQVGCMHDASRFGEQVDGAGAARCTGSSQRERIDHSSCAAAPVHGIALCKGVDGSEHLGAGRRTRRHQASAASTGAGRPRPSSRSSSECAPSLRCRAWRRLAGTAGCPRAASRGSSCRTRHSVGCWGGRLLQRRRQLPAVPRARRRRAARRRRQRRPVACCS